VKVRIDFSPFKQFDLVLEDICRAILIICEPVQTKGEDFSGLLVQDERIASQDKEIVILRKEKKSSLRSVSQASILRYPNFKLRFLHPDLRSSHLVVRTR